MADTTDRIALSHLRDDAERARTRSLRTITQQARLLDAALTALRNGDTDVAHEFVERSRDALITERDTLRADVPARRAD